MTPTFVILLIAGLFFASLLAVVLQGQLRSDHPWRRFAEAHGLTYHSDQTTWKFEGRYDGREITALGRDRGEAGGETRIGVAVRSDDESPGDRAESGLEERLRELQGAEPRLRYEEGQLLYEAPGVIVDRRRLAELVRRMVDSARYLEGTL